MFRSRKGFGWACRHLVLAAFVCTLGVLTPQAQAQKGYRQEGPPPPVKVEPAVFDFGTKDPNELINVTFTITNVGNQTLTIPEGDAGVRVSCHCTVPTLEQRRLRPGESMEIDATLDLRGSMGKVGKDFWVWFAPFEKHPVKFLITGKLAYMIEANPDKPNVQIAPRSTIELTARDQREFRVLRVNNDAPTIVKNNDGDGDGAATQWTILYDIKGISPIPYMQLVLTDHPKAEVVDIRSWGGAVTQPEIKYIKNHPRIFCNRNNANIGLLSPGESAEVGVAITRPTDQHNTDVIVSSPDERLTVEVIDVVQVDGRDRDQQYTLRITNNAEVDDLQMVLAPIYFNCGNHPGSEQHTTRMWIGGYIAPDGIAIGQR